MDDISKIILNRDLSWYVEKRGREGALGTCLFRPPDLTIILLGNIVICNKHNLYTSQDKNESEQHIFFLAQHLYCPFLDPK